MYDLLDKYLYATYSYTYIQALKIITKLKRNESYVQVYKRFKLSSLAGIIMRSRQIHHRAPWLELGSTMKKSLLVKTSLV